MQTNRWRPGAGQRGAVLLVVLVMVAVLGMVGMVFMRTVHDNELAIERSIASGRALELAQGANMWNLQQLWADMYQQPVGRRVMWAAVTTDDANGSKNRDGAEPPPAYQNAKYNVAWRIFGQGEITTKVTLKAIAADRSYADLELSATARVADAITGRTGNEEDKATWLYRSVRMVTRVGLFGQSRVFDFAYFANNFGWLYDSGGSAIRIFGNMGANGDLNFGGKPYVDGYLFAALNPAINATGTIMNGTAYFDDIVDYRNYQGKANVPAGSRPWVRVTDPAYTEDLNNNKKLDSGEDKNGNGVVDSIPSMIGYDGTQQRYLKQDPLDMPYLGDLAYYKSLAEKEGGSIKQLKKGGDPAKEADWELVVDKVYGARDTENGLYSEVVGNTVQRSNIPPDKKLETNPARKERNGNVALIGTKDQPLKITGPVVITNDLVIKGDIMGQGTIYTGRNLHVVGDMTYVNGPAWTQNDQNYTATEAANAQKDVVGFAVKGSVILGDYFKMKRPDKTPEASAYNDGDGWGSARGYFRTGFQNNKLQSYQTDPTDAAIGYYAQLATGVYGFHGDYTADVMVNGEPVYRYDSTDFSTKITQKYYESSFPDQYVKTLAVGKPGKIHGIFYTNHLYGGRPSDMELLGTMVSRDEGIVFNGYCHFFYDARAYSHAIGSRARIFLPQTSGYQVLIWEEIPQQ